MRFDNATHVEEAVWMMRLADLPRDENRTIINNLYNGNPPTDPDKAEENNITINYNDLEGVNLLAQARRQWNTAFLNTENYFTATLDSGAKHKRAEWSRTATRIANRYLKENRKQMEQSRATGANLLLHGPGMVTWGSRRSVVPIPLMVGSVMIPSETDIDFDNCSYIAFFREWTPAQLYGMTHGPRVDPGWQMDVVDSQWRYVRDQVMKQPNATAFQYMPARIEELAKQDLGLWASDAVPTVDAWDFYFREDDDGKGWYRRVILDWNVSPGTYADRKSAPHHANPDADGHFLYTSGKKKYANYLSEFFHCNCGDCSPVAPFKYHSMRSLGWMLWGVAHLQNLLHCRFSESVFKELLWFFRVANNADFQRLKVANFTHLGVIPAGITEILAKDRYSPNLGMVQALFNRNRSLMEDSAASFTQKFDAGAGGKEMREIEVLARLNQVNALMSGMLVLAYTYEDYKYKEQFRRLCIKTKPDPIAANFQRDCLKAGIPEELLDAECWQVRSERILGAGNKTLAMNQVQFLQSIRKNLGPDAQRQVDHLSIEINTDSPSLAEELAPTQGQKVASHSMNEASMLTERLMRGLPVIPRPDMVYEDYVKVWLADLEIMVNRDQQASGMASAEDIMGFQNMSKEIQGFIQIMAQDTDDKERVREYSERLAAVDRLVKAFVQRLTAKVKGNGKGAAPGADPKAMAQAQVEIMKGDVKLRNMEASHAQRTAQRQVQSELAEQRKDRETNAEIRRENAKAAAELLRDSTRPPEPFTE